MVLCTCIDSKPSYFRFLWLHTGFNQLQILIFSGIYQWIDWKNSQILHYDLEVSHTTFLPFRHLCVCVCCYGLCETAIFRFMSLVSTFLLFPFIFSHIACLPVIDCYVRSHWKTLWLKTATFMLYLSWFEGVKISRKALLNVSKAGDPGGGGGAVERPVGSWSSSGPEVCLYLTSGPLYGLSMWAGVCSMVASRQVAHSGFRVLVQLFQRNRQKLHSFVNLASKSHSTNCPMPYRPLSLRWADIQV